MYSFPNLQPAHCSMSDFNCCFLTCMQISQEADKVVWHSHFFKNIPQFVVIHTVKCFSIVNETEFPCFLYNPMNAGNLICDSSARLYNPDYTSESSRFMYYWNLAWRILSITLRVKWAQLCGSLNILWHFPPLQLEWKLTFSSPMVTAEFSKFADMLSATL